MSHSEQNQVSPPIWSYSTYSATLRKDGKPFAFITPDGRNAIDKENAAYIVDALNHLESQKAELAASIDRHSEQSKRLFESLPEDVQKRCLKRIGLGLTAAALLIVFPSCAYNSPGAKVNTPITINASLTPAGTQILP